MSIVRLNPYIAIWKAPAGASSELIAEWENYFATQVERSRLRVKLWRERYQEVADAIKGASCDTANAVGDSTFQRVQTEVNAQVDATIPHVDFAGNP